MLLFFASNLQRGFPQNSVCTSYFSHSVYNTSLCLRDRTCHMPELSSMSGNCSSGCFLAVLPNNDQFAEREGAGFSGGCIREQL